MAEGRRTKRKPSKASTPIASAPSDEERLAAVWVARLVVNRRQELRRCLNPDGLLPELSQRLGLKGIGQKPPLHSSVVRAIQRRLPLLERAAARRRGTIFSNLHRFADVLGLTPVEHELVLWAFISSEHRTFEAVLDDASFRGPRDVESSLASIIGVDVDEVRAALRPSGILLAAGLVELDTSPYRGTPVTIMDGVRRLLLQKNVSPEGILKDLVRPSAAASLDLTDFAHIAEHVGLLTTYLGRCLEEPRHGVNVLFYGKTGLGKTELARALAAELGAILFETQWEDEDGDSLTSGRRLASYRLTQRLVSDMPRALVLFDEVEDVFPASRSSFFGLELSSAVDKAFTNQLLDGNPVPSFWIANRVSQIDPAFLRRFDYIIELGSPPKEARRRILETRLGSLSVSENWLELRAISEELTPAEVERAARVVIELAPDGAEATERALDQVLDAGGRRDVPRRRATDSKHLPYDATLLRTNVDIAQLITGLRARRGGRLLLHGPPGTGKTRLAKHIADELGLPLRVQTASDILSRWIGQAEANIAEMFTAARREECVLLVDEVDSLLRARAGAHHSWEITQVNELLVQMERFDGVLICCTNLLDTLDPASLRRFPIKLRLDPLDAAARRRLLRAALALFEGAERTKRIPRTAQRALDRLDGLTPGDFAAVLERGLLLDLAADASWFVGELKAELDVRQDARRERIGFGAS